MRPYRTQTKRGIDKVKTKNVSDRHKYSDLAPSWKSVSRVNQFPGFWVYEIIVPFHSYISASIPCSDSSDSISFSPISNFNSAINQFCSAIRKFEFLLLWRVGEFLTVPLQLTSTCSCWAHMTTLTRGHLEIPQNVTTIQELLHVRNTTARRQLHVVYIV